MLYSLLDKLHQGALKRPITCISLWLIATVIAIFSLAQIEIDASYRSFFSPGDPLVISLDELHDQYITGDTTVFMVTVDEGDIFNKTALTAVESLTAEAWTLPKSVRVDSLTNFPYSRSQGDDLHVADLVEDAAKMSDAELAQIKTDTLNEPLIMKRLLSDDGQAALIVVTFNHETGESLEVNQEIYYAAQKIRDEYREKYPELGIYLSGVVSGNAAFTDVATSDGERIIPLAIVCALIAMFFYLWYEGGRMGTAASSMLGALAIINASVMIPMGLMVAMGIAANNVTSIIPVVILTLAVADALHILITYYQRLRAGDERKPALLESLRVNAEPVWLTSATTIMGFLALNFSESPPFRQMGNIVAIGVFTAWISANTLLPAIISLLPARVSQASRERHNPMPGLAKRVVRHYKLILGAGVLSLAAGIACIPLNTLNDSWSTYLTRDTDFGHDTSYLLDKFEDFNQVEFDMSSGREGGIFDPAYLQTVSEFADWLREQPEVRYVQSIDLTLKRLSKNMHGDDPAYYRMPQSEAEAAQYLLLYEMSLPYGADLTNDINIGKSSSRLVVGLRGSDTAYHLDVQDRIQNWLKENAPNMYHPGTSSTTIMANLANRDAKGMLWGTGLALLVIALTICIVFRSFKYGALSMLVNAMPATIALGIWGIVVGQVGISVSMVFAACLGIIVDYCVHFMSKYRRAKHEQNLTAEKAIEYAFSTVGVALLVTTAVLVINFGILGLSQFRLNIYMGVLTALTIVLALLCQLFLLPALLLAAERFSHRRKAKTKLIEATTSP